MKHLLAQIRSSVAPTLVASLAAAASASQLAQAAAVESANAFGAFDKWVGATIVTVPAAVPGKVESLKPADKGGASVTRFEPLPVILGLPDLPLLGIGAGQTSGSWGDTFNYHGIHARLLLIDGKTQTVSSAPLSTKLKPGQRFKLRITATFNGVAALDQLLGTAWDAERTGQVYPAPGMSVEVKAGKAVDLPIGAAQYFMLHGRQANERLLLSVRHAKAVGEGRNTQPAYRKDNVQGSSFLQLTPKGLYPIIEQVLPAVK
jgi:hypothetical protein